MSKPNPFITNLNEEVESQSSLIIAVKEPLSFFQKLGLDPSENSVKLNIPQEYLIGFYGIVLSFIIPSIARWYYKRRQSFIIHKYITKINMVYDSVNRNDKDVIHNNKDIFKKDFEYLRREIADTFSRGKLSESNYKILNEKIAEYEKILD